jgi:U3-containing 90S pre-ribosomal complex subunit
MAVGTPERLSKLIDADAVSLTSTSHLLLDVTYRDSKKQTLLDLADARLALFKALLANSKVMERLRGGADEARLGLDYICIKMHMWSPFRNREGLSATSSL